MPEKKRVTTAPLSDEEIAETLQEIPEEEFLLKFDEIQSRDKDLPERLEALLTLDDYMENELRDMFQSIIAQYIRPIEYAVERLRAGDQAKRTAQEGLDALAPILTASESLNYRDIAENLKQIERPLRDLAGGVKRRLTKREVTELSEAWDRLDTRLRPDGDREAAVAPALSIGALTGRLDGVTDAHVRSLRGAGLLTLHDVASAPLGDLVAVTGLPHVVAERVHSFAVGAVAVASTTGRRSTDVVPPGWMRVQVESEIFRGDLMFEFSRLGKYLEPILAKLAEADTPPRPPAPKPRSKPAPARAPQPRRAKQPAEKKRTK